MNKEIEIFARNEEMRKTRKIDFNKQLNKVHDELKKQSYEEKIHQTDKNQEFGGVHLRIVGCEKILVTQFLFVFRLTCSSYQARIESYIESQN